MDVIRDVAPTFAITDRVRDVSLELSDILDIDDRGRPRPETLDDVTRPRHAHEVGHLKEVSPDLDPIAGTVRVERRAFCSQIEFRIGGLVKFEDHVLEVSRRAFESALHRTLFRAGVAESDDRKDRHQPTVRGQHCETFHHVASH